MFSDGAYNHQNKDVLQTNVPCSDLLVHEQFSVS